MQRVAENTAIGVHESQIGVVQVGFADVRQELIAQDIEAAVAERRSTGHRVQQLAGAFHMFFSAQGRQAGHSQQAFTRLVQRVLPLIET